MIKKRLFIFLLFTILLTPSVFAIEKSESAKLLAQAEEAFKNGMELVEIDQKQSQVYFNEAAIYYKSLIDSGIKNSSLYYNLANTYYRLNKTGYAILNYRKALLYSPTDKQIKYNLEYVRTLQKNGFELETENEILQIVFFLHYLMPTSIKIIILIIANIIFWGSLLLIRFDLNLRKTLVISLIILILSATSVYIDFRNSNVLHGVITANEAIGRLGDSKSYESAYDGALFQGVEFTIKQKRPGWLLAELPDGELVWLEASLCKIVEE